MSESVQYYLESMVPELRDLEEKELFSKSEIKSMIKKRTDFEYALRRRAAQKVDFTKYIQYEQTVESLRKKRMGRYGSGYKISLCDYAWKQRLHGLFNRALKKFPGDTALWTQYITFAKKTDARKALGSIFTRAIQKHPRDSTFWIMAAGWEFEANANISTARKLFQRALRLNETSEDLYLQFFKMEVLYVRKILLRSDIINGNVISASEEPEQLLLPTTELLEGEAANEDSEYAPLIIPRLDEKVEIQPTVPLPEDEVSLVDYIVPSIIFKDAIQKIPRKLEFRKRFIDITMLAPKPGALLDEIYDTLPRDFPNMAEAYGFVLQRPAYGVLPTDPAYPFALKDTIEKYSMVLIDGTLDISYRVSLAEDFIGFMCRVLKITSEENLREYLKDNLINIYSTLEKQSILSPAILKMYFDQLDSVPYLLFQLVSDVKEKFVNDPVLVCKIAMLDPSNENFVLAERHTHTAAERVEVYLSITKYWESNILENTLPQPETEGLIDQLCSQWKALHRLPSGKGSVMTHVLDQRKALLMQQYLNLVYSMLTVDALSTATTRLLSVSSYQPLSLIKAIVDVYEAKSPTLYTDMRKLYELGTQTEEGKTDMAWWIQYMKLERSCKNFAGVMQLRWKAKKVFGESEELEKAWASLHAL